MYRKKRYRKERWRERLLVFFFGVCLAATATGDPGALEDEATGISAAEAAEAVNRRLDERRLGRFLGGEPASSIFLSSGESLERWLDRLLGGAAYELPLSGVAALGGPAGAGGWQLTGSLSAAASLPLSGAGYSLVGGILSSPGSDPCEDALFCDGFESGDTGGWSSQESLAP